MPNLEDFVTGFMEQSVDGNPAAWGFLMTGKASWLNQLQFVHKEDEPGIATLQEDDEAYDDGYEEGHLKGESSGFCSGYKSGYADGFAAARKEVMAELRAGSATAVADPCGEGMLALCAASEEDLRAIDEAPGSSSSGGATVAGPATSKPSAPPSSTSGAAVCPSWYDPGLESWLGLSKTKKKQLRSKQARL